MFPSKAMWIDSTGTTYCISSPILQMVRYQSVPRRRPLRVLVSLLMREHKPILSVDRNFNFILAITSMRSTSHRQCWAMSMEKVLKFYPCLTYRLMLHCRTKIESQLVGILESKSQHIRTSSIRIWPRSGHHWCPRRLALYHSWSPPGYLHAQHHLYYQHLHSSPSTCHMRTRPSSKCHCYSSSFLSGHEGVTNSGYPEIKYVIGLIGESEFLTVAPVSAVHGSGNSFFWLNFQTKASCDIWHPQDIQPAFLMSSHTTVDTIYSNEQLPPLITNR